MGGLNRSTAVHPLHFSDDFTPSLVLWKKSLCFPSYFKSMSKRLSHQECGWSHKTTFRFCSRSLRSTQSYLVNSSGSQIRCHRASLGRFYVAGSCSFKCNVLSSNSLPCEAILMQTVDGRTLLFFWKQSLLTQDTDLRRNLRSSSIHSLLIRFIAFMVCQLG